MVELEKTKESNEWNLNKLTYMHSLMKEERLRKQKEIRESVKARYKNEK